MRNEKERMLPLQAETNKSTMLFSCLETVNEEKLSSFIREKERFDLFNVNNS